MHCLVNHAEYVNRIGLAVKEVSSRTQRSAVLQPGCLPLSLSAAGSAGSSAEAVPQQMLQR